MKFATLLRCGLAALMLLVGTTADAQGFFRTWRANRAARIQANMAAMGSPATRSYTPTSYETVSYDSMDCSSGVCVPRTRTFRRAVAPAVAVYPGSYRATTYAAVGSAGSHGGTASYVGYAAAPVYQTTSNGSDGGGPIYEAAKPAPTQRAATCTCNGECDCPDCPCRPAAKAEVEEDDGLDLYGDAEPSDDGASVFAFKPTEDASPFAYRPAPSSGAIAGL